MNLTFTPFRALLILSSFFLATTNLVAQQVAFPGAEGAGKYATGGRGTPTVPTTVFEVTNLSDVNAVGSLRYALTASVNTFPHRTIVFRVSGTINLLSRLTIPRNTTIAGQTAPGGGICLADRPVVINGDNVIIRHLRIRMGDRYQNNGLNETSGGDDTFGDLGHKNIILDHCSISWSSDEACTIYRGDSVTIQYCLVSEPLNYSYHYENPGPDFQEHGYVGIWGAKNGSFHHNLLAHAKGRMPRFAGVSTYTPAVTGVENVDFRNNVIYHWLSYSTNGGEGGNYNLVNNYYKYGPNTSTGSSSGVPIRSMIMNPSKSAAYPYPKMFIDGNHVDGNPAVTANNWRGVAFAGGTMADSTNSKVSTPFEISPVTTQSAAGAYEVVLQNAGATLPARDTLDERIVLNVRNRTGRVIDVQGGFPHGTPYAQTVTAWPTLISTTPPADTDRDGMPDNWEIANGLNPNDPADRNQYTANGYTQLENYLNGITSGALPLSLVSFTAMRMPKEVQASWSTAREVNTSSFVVERSSDGVVFAPVGTVAARNTAQTNTYSFTDKDPLNTLAFYRLKMIDKDGALSYSPVVKVNPYRKMLLSVNPNPVVNEVLVNHDPAVANSFIRIMAADGRLVSSVRPAQSATRTRINGSLLKSGTYYIVMENGGGEMTTRFVKK
ncbi:T9SS type A sorting domain-containing protein [Segetibacter sp. 3557_3]|uniref:T9SS type A sorting domain-containing protein n=1 Tax=Segetibacter sp. 3557_3 TaxID=2547429 RepID=UPI00140427C2|nr:T9SS type A sorting domain-containing protein [Segetibacter sp. 3557_3]